MSRVALEATEISIALGARPHFRSNGVAVISSRCEDTVFAICKPENLFILEDHDGWKLDPVLHQLRIVLHAL
jgi:hypothetical protein